MSAVDTPEGSDFPRGLARETTPLGMFGGDLLIYRSIILLTGLALPAIATVNWFLRGTPSWPQLGLAGAVLACAVACYLLARSGRRDVAAAVLIGSLWLMVTIYCFNSGYGMHSSMVFVYLPCMLYTALFFGLAMASAGLVLTIAALLAMYVAEAQGLIAGAANFVAQSSNFNFLFGVVLTCIGTLVAGAVYHRRVEREAARVVAAAEERRVALEQAQAARAQLESAHAQVQALNRDLAGRDAAREEQMAQVRRDLELLHEAVSKEIPATVRAMRASLAAPDEGTAARLAAGLGRIDTVIAALDALGTRPREPMKREQINVSQLAREAIAQLDATREFPGLRFEVVPGLHAVGDRRMIATLLRHLASRAARACRGEPEPLVRVGGGSMQGQPVFYVSDNGAGLDAAQRERMFKPFDRVAGEREDTLDVAALCARHVVEQHGGELTVDSAPGRGTTFFFSLPGAPAA